MATRVQPWHHLCYQPNFRVLQQDCDGTSTTLPTSTHWSASECSYHCANRTFLGDDSTWRRQTGSSFHISSMRPWRTSPPHPNAMTSSWTPYEKSPERTSLVGVEGTMSQAWHPSPLNWSKNTERNTKTIPSQIVPSHSGRNWWAPSQRNAVKHGRPWSNQQTWPTTARRRGPRYASFVTTRASRSSTTTPLRTKWHTNSYITEEYRTDNRKYASIDSDTRTTRDSREHLLQRNSTSASEYWRTAKHPAWMTSKRSWSSSLDPRHATGYFVFLTTVLRLRKFRRSGERLR